MNPPSLAPQRRFSWPLAPPHPVLRRFDPPSAPWAAGHRGVDLGGTPGEPVLAVADGVVVFAGMLVDRYVISVDHAGEIFVRRYAAVSVVARHPQVHRRPSAIALRVGADTRCRSIDDLECLVDER